MTIRKGRKTYVLLELLSQRSSREGVLVVAVFFPGDRLGLAGRSLSFLWGFVDNKVLELVDALGKPPCSARGPVCPA